MGAAALPAASMAASAGGSIIGARSALQQGQAGADALNYQAAVARNNQQIAEEYALMEKQRGSVLAQNRELKTGQQVGSINAATGAAGLDTAGTPERLTADTMSMGDLDARMIRYNAEKAAYGYKVQGSSFGAQATLDEMGAKDSVKSGRMAALGSIIGGGASVSDKWARYKMSGAGGGSFSGMEG